MTVLLVVSLVNADNIEGARLRLVYPRSATVVRRLEFRGIRDMSERRARRRGSLIQIVRCGFVCAMIGECRRNGRNSTQYCR